jgi:pimeloyl-ACP methyl ester carboxylesterase
MHFFIIIIALTFSIAATAESLLDRSIDVTGFGKVHFRAPINIGNKKPIVLFHGIYGGASHRTWRELLPILDQAGEKVFIMDLPGVGDSAKPKRAYTIADLDDFVEKFLVEVVKERATVVSESIMSNSVLKVSALRPDLVRRAVVLNPSGIFSLVDGPSPREQALYDRLFNDEDAATAFYKNLLNPNSLKYFLKFGFFDDSLVNDKLIADFSVMRSNIDQKYLTLSFVGGQLFRSFEESSEGVFIPVLCIFGKEYEAFQDNRIATATDFKAIRPYFEFYEIAKSGASVQREKPLTVAQKLIEFSVLD